MNAQAATHEWRHDYEITITAAFGRVQVEVPQAAAERLMLDAVRTTGTAAG